MDFDPSRFNIGAAPGEEAKEHGASFVDDDSIDDIEDEPAVQDESIEAASDHEDTQEVREARGLLLIRQYDAAAGVG